MRFSQELWQENYSLYQATLALPFNRELAAGSLAEESFRHYIIQDAHYLEAYGRALAVCAAKAYEARDILQFADFAREIIAGERQLHEGFMQQFGISADAFAAAPLSAATHHYNSYLLATAWSESYPVVMAALLPCFWIYAEVGKAVYEQSAADNPYQAWIDTYAGEEFQASVAAIIAMIDRVAAQSDAQTLTKMRRAYRYAAVLEWQFWDSSYQCRGWPGLADDQAP